MSQPDVDEFVARFDDDDTAWLRLTDDAKLELFVAATARMWVAENKLDTNNLTDSTLADLQRVVATNALHRIAVLVNNARATHDVAFGKQVNAQDILDDIEVVLEESCHCGRANFTDENLFTRFMCEPCTLVRCDATPCPPCPELNEYPNETIEPITETS